MAFGGFLKEDTAVDILIGPFLDDADGKTAETGLTLDVELSKNGQALANKNDATTPVHDAAGDVDGYYNCELDSTDTDTPGTLTVVAHASGALPVRLDFQVLQANAYDSLFGAAAADYLQVDITQCGGSAVAAGAIPNAAADAAGGLPISDAGGLDLDAMNTNIDDIETDTGTTLQAELDGMQGADGKCVISTDAQDLSGTLDVNTKTISTDAVNADALNADAVTEIWAKAMSDLAAGAPSATASVLTAINYLYEAWRNKMTVTSTEIQLYKDDASTKLAESTISDDGTTFSRGEMRAAT